MVNEQKRCVNSACPTVQNCICEEAGLTVTPTRSPTVTPVSIAEASPTQPVTGLKIPTATGILGGLLLISFGLALIF